MSYTLNIQNSPFFHFSMPNNSSSTINHWKISFQQTEETHSWDDFLKTIENISITEETRPFSIQFQDADLSETNIIKLFNVIFHALYHQKVPDPEGIWYQIGDEVKYEPPQGFEGRRRFTLGMWERHCQRKTREREAAYTAAEQTSLLQADQLCSTCREKISP